MSAAEMARDAAWIEQVQSRRPLPPTPSQASRRSTADDLDPAVTRERRAELLEALGETS